MDFYKVVKTRRSVRSYNDAEVSDELIEKLIRVAMTAPSAGNQQPWHFIIIRDRDKMDAIPAFHPYCKMITKASAAVMVCGDPVGKKWPDFWVQDCSAAVQNLLLAARAEELAAVWTGIYPVEERIVGCRKLFLVPENIIPFAVIPIGWPKDRQNSKEIDRFAPELIHRETFGEKQGR